MPGTVTVQPAIVAASATETPYVLECHRREDAPAVWRAFCGVWASTDAEALEMARRTLESWNEPAVLAEWDGWRVSRVLGSLEVSA